MKEATPAISQISEEEDVIRKSLQNPENFRVLYERYYRNIFLFILHRVGDKPLTADLTSQVFFKALMNLSRYRFRGLPFSAWLYRIAVNECNDFFRKEKRARCVVLEESVAENLYEEMFTADAREELKEKLPRALERLRPEELQLIELRYMENRPFREVAAILDITENNAKVKVYRVLDKMRKLLLK